VVADSGGTKRGKVAFVAQFGEQFVAC